MRFQKDFLLEWSPSCFKRQVELIEYQCCSVNKARWVRWGDAVLLNLGVSIWQFLYQFHLPILVIPAIFPRKFFQILFCGFCSSPSQRLFFSFNLFSRAASQDEIPFHVEWASQWPVRAVIASNWNTLDKNNCFDSSLCSTESSVSYLTCSINHISGRVCVCMQSFTGRTQSCHQGELPKGEGRAALLSLTVQILSPFKIQWNLWICVARNLLDKYCITMALTFHCAYRNKAVAQSVLGKKEPINWSNSEFRSIVRLGLLWTGDRQCSRADSKSRVEAADMQTQKRECKKCKHTNKTRLPRVSLLIQISSVSSFLPWGSLNISLARLCILMPPICSAECHCKCVFSKWPSHIWNYFLPIHSPSAFSSFHRCLHLHCPNKITPHCTVAGPSCGNLQSLVGSSFLAFELHFLYRQYLHESEPVFPCCILVNKKTERLNVYVLTIIVKTLNVHHLYHQGNALLWCLDWK